MGWGCRGVKDARADERVAGGKGVADDREGMA